MAQWGIEKRLSQLSSRNVPMLLRNSPFWHWSTCNGRKPLNPVQSFLGCSVWEEEVASKYTNFTLPSSWQLRKSLFTLIDLAKNLQSCTVVSGMLCMRRLFWRNTNLLYPPLDSWETRFFYTGRLAMAKDLFIESSLKEGSHHGFVLFRGTIRITNSSVGEIFGHAWSVTILVFPNPAHYMLSSFKFSSLIWGRIHRFV